MSKKRFVVFDLDQTLADTAHLAQFRAAQDWARVAEMVHAVRAFEGIDHMIERAREIGYLVAIVTNSPQPYCDDVCNACDLKADVTVCAGDVKYPKPASLGVKLALAKLGGYSGRADEPSNIQRFVRDRKLNLSAVLIGDSWADILAASDSGVDSIAALWAASDPHEIISAEPTYIADSIADCDELLVQLAQSPWPITSANERAARRYRETLWRQHDNSDHVRSNLRPDASFFSARDRWQGNWITSCGNSLVKTLKTKPDRPALEWVKDRAARRFASDLSFLLPQGAHATFIASSKLQGHPEYDNRFELVTKHLVSFRRDVGIIAPIQPVTSGQAVHESDDAGLRRPEVIMENLRWTGDVEKNARELFIIDDVLTSGGHFEAYLRFLDQNAPNVNGVGVFWALHHSQERPVQGP